ncbi:MAG: hypothetical protein E6496_03175 [Lachnoanaerobaculum sp.]|nr:hypothetical protein [Lachnoanaerobaculum sp.]
METTYKLMKFCGGAGIAIGVIMIVVGVATGVMSIVNGARLLAGKKHIEF